MEFIFHFCRPRTSRLFVTLFGVALSCVTIRAEEKQNNLLTSLSSTTVNGYVNTSIHWDPGAGNSIPEPATGTLLFAGAAVLILFNAGRSRDLPALVTSKKPAQ